MGGAMIGRTTDGLPVTLSIKLYRLFLFVYPKSFRREYGSPMLQLFRDYSIRTYDRSGLAGMLMLWALTLLDLLRSAVEQYLNKETLMTKNTLIRLSGWAIVIGGVASAMGFVILLLSEAFGSATIRISGTFETISVAAFFFGPVGVGLGLLGVRTRFGEDVGALGKNALLLGAIVGTSMVLIGDFMQFALAHMSDRGFTNFAIGLLLIFACLELYGIQALRRKPQARWNGLAAVAGFPVSAIGVIVAIAGPGSSFVPYFVSLVFSGLMVVMGVALVMLGYLVQLVPSEDEVTNPVAA
jgi:hypothetical protein